MFITLTNHDLKFPVILQSTIDNTGDRGLCVALCEMFYTVKWFNISKAKNNNTIVINKDFSTLSVLIIPDGYYGFCMLQKILEEKDISIKLNPANLKVTLTLVPNSHYAFDVELAKLLGFDVQSFTTDSDNFTFEGDYPVDLTHNPILCVHLDEINTSQNLHNGRPSTMLRVLPAGNVAYCDSQNERFTNLQFKQLANGHFESLNIRVTNQDGKDVNCDKLCIILEIK
jgi:hypothetical protein